MPKSKNPKCAACASQSVSEAKEKSWVLLQKNQTDKKTVVLQKIEATM